MNYLWAGMTLTGILWGAFHGQLQAVTDGALQASKEAVALCITMLGVMTLWTGVLEIAHRAGLVDQLSEKMSPVLSFLFPRLEPEGEARKQIAVNMIANVLGLGWAATPAGLRAMEELKKVEEERREKESRGEPVQGTGSRGKPVQGIGSRGEPVQRTGSRGEPVQRTGSRTERKESWEEEPVPKTLQGMGQKGRRLAGAGKAQPPGTASNEMCTFLIINISSLQLIPMNMIAYRSQYKSVNPGAIVGPALAATLISTVVAVVYCKIMDT
ncbi:MAG: nucleoside recognition protein [Clostridium sp.]|nr:nucleoside recognition protein [Clostridium sp.]